MAQEPHPGTLPVYYGERMNDGTVVESPRVMPNGPRHAESRDALLRLPIQPGEAHLHPEPVSPKSPVTPGQGLGIQTINTIPPTRSNSKKVGSDPNRWVTYVSGDRADDYNHRSRRYEEVGPEPRASVPHRGAYVEEYYDDEDDRPRVYRRPVRGHARPPLSHNQLSAPPSRMSRDQGVRASMESYRSHRPSMDYQEPTPTKKGGWYYHPGDGDEGPPYSRAYAGGGGDYKGPPRRPPSTEEVMRLPWTMWMNSNAKNHFVAFIGEFVGTTMFLFFAFSGTQVANIGSADDSDLNTTTGADTGFSPQVLQYIALVFAFSLMVNVWIFFRISGGLFNPAVTFAMLLTKSMSPLKFTLLLIAQLAGAIFSSYLVTVLFPTPLNVRTTLSADTSLAQGVFIEAILTAELVFTIFMLAKEKHKATFIAPVGIGLSLFIAELVGIYYTGGSLNPARSFGPCVVTGVFDREHWIYWVGPGLGAIIAVAFYRFIKILEYEMANPGQDDDDKDQEVKEVQHKA